MAQPSRRRRSPSQGACEVVHPVGRQTVQLADAGYARVVGAVVVDLTPENGRVPES
ncbi:hypothetical protein [Nocardioides astragali]|uniref:Uncharacterized protein n=1 Tax=Nocardioides astragali TaxID=1776736 RepID=A0ABW2N8D3_9ACTN|nr:hypothetical protein [Nocardioides astragali]